MRFKNSRQRKAVMTKLTYNQLKNRGIRIRPYSDTDKDGIKNIKDCRPLNKNEQGFIHAMIEKREKKLDKQIKKQQKIAEKEQDRLLKETDKESIKLSKQLSLNRKIEENKRLKHELENIKKARFYQTKTGKLAIVTGKTAVTVGTATGKTLKVAGQGISRIAKSKTTKKLLKKIFS